MKTLKETLNIALCALYAAFIVVVVIISII